MSLLAIIFMTLLFFPEHIKAEEEKFIIIEKVILKQCLRENSLCFSLGTNENNELNYKITKKSEILVSWSKLGLRGKKIFLLAKNILKQEESALEKTYTLPHGKKKKIEITGKITKLTFKANENLIWILETYQSLDGVAFRYIIPKFKKNEEPLHIKNELTEFSLEGKGDSYLQEYQKSSLVSPSYEGWYEKGELNRRDSGGHPWYLRVLNPLAEYLFSWNFFGSDGFSFPALFKIKEN